MSVLDSVFIIDGVPQDMTLRELLDPESAEAGKVQGAKDVVDESILEDLAEPSYQVSQISKYGLALASKLRGGNRNFSLTHSDFCTLRDINSALLETLFCDGIFNLNELTMGLLWKWNIDHIGNAAALYSSVYAASDFLDSLGIKINRYLLEKHSKCSFQAHCTGVSSDGEFMDFISSAVDGLEQHHEESYIADRQICDRVLLPEEDSTVIFIPFDQAAPSLAGSAFSAFISHVGSGVSAIGDPDYFSDCYQVCREIIKDGIAMSAIPVCCGGLYYAASRLAEGGCGLDLSTGSLESMHPDKDLVEILFSEIPGLLMQISSFDRDYVDTQLLLQEVAYYTVGKPTLKHKGLKISYGNGGSVSLILDMLLSSSATEGED